MPPKTAVPKAAATAPAISADQTILIAAILAEVSGSVDISKEAWEVIGGKLPPKDGIAIGGAAAKKRFYRLMEKWKAEGLITSPAEEIGVTATPAKKTAAKKNAKTGNKDGDEDEVGGDDNGDGIKTPPNTPAGPVKKGRGRPPGALGKKKKKTEEEKPATEATEGGDGEDQEQAGEDGKLKKSHAKGKGKGTGTKAAKLAQEKVEEAEEDQPEQEPDKKVHDTRSRAASEEKTDDDEKPAAKKRKRDHEETAKVDKVAEEAKAVKAEEDDENDEVVDV